MHFCRKQLWLCSFLLLGIIALSASNTFAAATGQIKGQLVDKDTKEPVIGASVMVVGTKRGAMTDPDGRYIIGQLEPGTYSVQVSHMEYNSVTVTDVVVKSDITTDVSQELAKKVSELDVEIVVKDEYDNLKIFETANQVTISKEAIQTQPVSTVDDLLTQVSGVVTNRQGEVFIRGGRAFEVAYVVDGVPLRDPLGGLGQAGDLPCGGPLHPHHGQKRCDLDLRHLAFEDRVLQGLRLLEREVLAVEEDFEVLRDVRHVQLPTVCL